MKTRLFVIGLFTALLLANVSQAALPTAERTPGTGSAPIEILGSEPDGVYISTFGDFKDQFLFTWSGTSLTIIDLETWTVNADQPDAFLSSIVDVKLLGDGTSLIVLLSSGDFATLDLSDTDSWANTIDNSDNDDDEEDEDSRETDLSTSMTTAGATALAVDPDDGSDTIYFIDESNQNFYEFDISGNSLTTITLGSSSEDDDEEDTTGGYTPTDIAFAESAAGDQILLTTSTGEVLVKDPGDSSFTEVALSVRDDDTTTPNLETVSITPDGDFAFIIDTDNDVIWVYSFSSGDFVDQTSSGTSLDPLEFESDENSSLESISFLNDSSTSTVVGYVTGSAGISFIDATSPGSKSDDKILDQDTSTSDVLDPLSLSGTPAKVVSLSDDQLTLITANGDASLSVISDNPFVTVEGASVSSITETDSTFTLTFQTDEAGTYTVRANSDPTGTDGTELIDTTTVSDADTDTTTATIDINDFTRTTFVEGSNKFFVFVTDAEGNVGWDAAIVTVDRPPEAIDITSTSFGNGRIFVNFEPSTDEDIASYTLFAEPAASQSNPSCPGSLTFTSDDAISASVAISACSTTSCSGSISGLTNDVQYCLAVRATDESDQAGDISGFNLAESPEATVGPAEFLGETGCSLTRKDNGSNFGLMAFLFAGLGFLLLSRLTSSSQGSSSSQQGLSSQGSLSSRAKTRDPHRLWIITLLLIASAVFPTNTNAEELTPQMWTLEFRGGHWFPTRSQVRNFLGGCCNIYGEAEFGWLAKNQFNVTGTVGFSYLSRNAVGLTSGGASGETFKLMIIPIRVDFTYRADFKEDQMFVPYGRVGVDSVMFREYGANQDLFGNKFGGHAGLGVGFLLDTIEPLSYFFEKQVGVNDVYLNLEGRYAYINSFSSTGMDFSGFYTTLGLMFIF